MNPIMFGERCSRGVVTGDHPIEEFTVIRNAREYGVMATTAFAAVWLIAATVVEGTTFHLAPMIVAAAGPAIAPSSRRTGAVGIAAGIAGGASVILRLTGRLDGPSLLPFGDALVETIVAIAAGLLIGWLTAGSLHRPETAAVATR